MKIGRQIWQNECAGTVEGLTSWNAGEDFASLGIGHFIWYPEGKRGPFEESFPALIGYLQQQGVRPPAWTIHRPCPWPTKAVFDAQQNSAQMKELRAFLADTVLLQTRFIIARMEASLPKMLQAAPRGRAEHVRAQFYRLAGSTAGMYALIDYVNFKGEGVSPTERYRGQGWGLLQVLDGMPGTTAQPVREFAESGKRVLAQRVRNAPPARNEGRWTAGWNNRMDTYPRF
ncbi:MAG: hypothetical protein ACFCU3_02435 [Verrucomicrobiales bacterium]